jgi:hypothetical protein
MRKAAGGRPLVDGATTPKRVRSSSILRAHCAGNGGHYVRSLKNSRFTVRGKGRLPWQAQLGVQVRVFAPSPRDLLGKARSLRVA